MRACPQCGNDTVSALSVAFSGPARPAKCRSCQAYVLASFPETLKALGVSLLIALAAFVVVIAWVTVTRQYQYSGVVGLVGFAAVSVAVVARLGWYWGKRAPLRIATAAQVRRARIISALLLVAAVAMFAIGPPSGWAWRL